MPKQARLTGIKRFQTYTVEEAAAVSGVSARTIRTWTKDGLCVMDAARPALIRGDALHDYIKSKRSARAVRTRIDTFYCVCCRAERAAAERMADCVVAGGRAKLTALCEVCATVVSKPVAETAISHIARTLDLKITRQD